MKLKIVLITLLLLIAVPGSVIAHGHHEVRTYAYQLEGKIVVEGVTAHGNPLAEAEVKIYDSEGELLKQGVTDEQGHYKFELTDWSVVRIVLVAHGGHTAEYKLSNYKLAPENTSQQVTASQTQISAEQLQSIIHQEVKPLKRRIAQLQSKKQSPGVTEILGGLGYILGLAGIALYFKAHQRLRDDN
ncbi:hypothetical protein [Halanaerobaculum tunisiense]